MDGRKPLDERRPAGALSADRTRAAYRVGDSSTNIVTPLLPYFPPVVLFCSRYARDAGIGTVVAIMLRCSVTLLVGWTLFLMGCWALALPFGIGAGYHDGP